MSPPLPSSAEKVAAFDWASILSVILKVPVKMVGPLHQRTGGCAQFPLNQLGPDQNEANIFFSHSFFLWQMQIWPQQNTVRCILVPPVFHFQQHPDSDIRSRQIFALSDPEYFGFFALDIISSQMYFSFLERSELKLRIWGNQNNLLDHKGSFPCVLCLCQIKMIFLFFFFSGFVKKPRFAFFTGLLSGPKSGLDPKCLVLSEPCFPVTHCPGRLPLLGAVLPP